MGFSGLTIYFGALHFTGLPVDERSRLLSDNGSCYVSGVLKEFLDEVSITHIRGKPLHPQVLAGKTSSVDHLSPG